MNATMNIAMLTNKDSANALMANSTMADIQAAIATLNANLTNVLAYSFVERVNSAFATESESISKQINAEYFNLKSKNDLLDELLRTHKKEDLEMLGLIEGETAVTPDFKEIDKSKLSLSVNGSMFKYSYLDGDNNPKATSGRKRKPDVIMAAIKDGTVEKHNIFESDENMLLLAKSLIESGEDLEGAEIKFEYDFEAASVDANKPKRTTTLKGKKIAPKYVFKENGEIRVWSGKGVAPLPLKEARHLAKNGFGEKLASFEINASNENMALFEEYKALEGKAVDAVSTVERNELTATA